MPEKLMTIQEASKFLGLPEDEVKRLVDIGEIPAYKIGGSFLRFRRDQLEAVRKEVDLVEAEVATHPASAPVPARPPHAYTDLEREIKRREPLVGRYDYTFFERVTDFWYFLDFYIVAFALVGVIVYVIFH